MLVKYNEDRGFSKVKVTRDLEESGVVGLVSPEKVLERMGELDLVSIDTSCDGLCLKEGERNGAVVGEGGGVKRRVFFSCVFKIEQHVSMLMDVILKKEN